MTEDEYEHVLTYKGDIMDLHKLTSEMLCRTGKPINICYELSLEYLNDRDEINRRRGLKDLPGAQGSRQAMFQHFQKPT